MVDSLITLFPSASTEFTTNGLGGLPDAASCTVHEELNGEYELQMTYPITGKRYNELQMRRIILAKPNPYSQPQPFLIYEISKPINGLVTVNAEHISYDLSGYPISPFEAGTASEAFANMVDASVVPCPFTFSTDITTEAPISFSKPTSIRYVLGDSDGGILDVYGGEYEFDVFNVKLLENRGADRGVSIRYGKNLTDLEQEENCRNVYTGVYPFWYSENDGLVQLEDKIVNAEGTYDFVRICTLDLSSSFGEKPTEEQLKEAAERYMTDNEIGIPKVSLTVSFARLTRAGENKIAADLDKVMLGDTVNISFPELNVNATAKCIATTYNVLVQKYDDIELGEPKSNVASTLSEQSKSIKEASTAPVSITRLQGLIPSSNLDNDTQQAISDAKYARQIFDGEEIAEYLKCEKFYFDGHFVRWSNGTLIQDD